jgi:hypothetical protein
MPGLETITVDVAQPYWSSYRIEKFTFKYGGWAERSCALLARRSGSSYLRWVTAVGVGEAAADEQGGSRAELGRHMHEPSGDA